MLNDRNFKYYIVLTFKYGFAQTNHAKTFYVLSTIVSSVTNQMNNAIRFLPLWTLYNLVKETPSG